MNPVTPPEREYPSPEIVLPENAFSDGPYYVNLGDQRFTQAQWELIQLYAEGFHRAQLEAAQGQPTEHKAQRQNAEFHKVMGIHTPRYPRAIPSEDVPVVIELIREEFIDELIPALGARIIWTHDGKIGHLVQTHEPNVVEIYDALIDILYVTYGALNRAGMQAEPGYDEVQASNMSKLGADGKPIIAGPNDPDGIFEGRIKKGPDYFRPNLTLVLREQGWPGEDDPRAGQDFDWGNER